MIRTIVLPMPLPMRSTNAYLIRGDELTLVDTGPKSARTLQALRAALAAEGLGLADIEQVIVTHPHLDHFGLARRIVDESGARVFVHPQGLRCLTDYEAEQGCLADASGSRIRQAGAPEDAWAILRLRTSMLRYHAESVQAECVSLLQDGQTLSLDGLMWQVLSVPGHCLGHICLYQADTKRLISGDSLLPDYSFVPVPYPVSAEDTGPGQVSAFAQSLERLGALDIVELLPGHGQPGHNASEIVARERANQARARQRLQAALAQGRQTAYELWRSCPDAFQAFDVLTGIEVVYSYLKALQDEGTVAVSEEGGLITYSQIQ